MRLELEEFKEWMVVITESGEEDLRSGSVFKGKVRVHYKGYWEESPALGLSLMLESDLQKVWSLAENIDNKLVIDIREIVQSDIPLAFASNAMGFRRIPPEEFSKIEKGDLVTAMVSVDVDKNGKTWLNAMNVELSEKGDLESFRHVSASSEYKVRTSAPPPQDNSTLKGTAFRHQSTRMEAKNMRLDLIASSEEEMRDIYWNIR